MPELEQGKIYQKSGWMRQIISIKDNFIEIKTIGIPAIKVRGRPPGCGMIRIASFRRWLKKTENGIKNKKIQLIV
jgi:hypothetical protein